MPPERSGSLGRFLAGRDLLAAADGARKALRARVGWRSSRFANPSGLSGSAPRAALVIALIFLLAARALYRLGQNVEGLLDEEPEDES